MSAVACAYCKTRRGHQVDHLINSNQSRRSPAAARERNNPKYMVPCCRFCNEAKGTRCRVPVGYAGLIPELEALTHNVYATFDGSAEDLRRVVR